jgi:ABC-2 type transport system permease protein
MGGRLIEPRVATPGWWLVASQELHDLWIGGRAIIFLILFSVLLGVMSFLLATNSELSLIPPKEMVFLTLQVALAVSLFLGLIIGADSVSGERERATLEGLLLTPTSRRQIIVGKFLAAVSPWPAALAISAPYLALLSPDGTVFVQTLLWGALLGTLLVASFTAFGVLVSVWSNSNKSSLFMSLGIYVLFLVPTQFPGTAQAGAVGQLIKRLNPLEASNQFLEKVLVNNRTPEEMVGWLLMPVLFSILVLALLFWYASPGLRLEGGRASILRSSWGRVAGLLIIASACIMALGARPAMALQDPELPVRISVDMDSQVLKTGDHIEFNTLVTSRGTEVSPSMIVAMNIVNLAGDGDPVDPEDWSPERAQYIERLAPGQSTSLTWTIRAILEGDYMVYMVVIPEPAGPEVTSHPVSSSGIHLTVMPFARLNPGGVLPLALAMPMGLTLAVSLLRWRRRRGIDMAGSP